MNQILAMREKRASLWDAAKKYRDSHIDTDGTMTAEDAAVYDRMVDDVDRMKKEIDRLERQEAIENEMNRPTASPILSRPENPITGDEKKGRAAANYKNAFWQTMRSKSVPHEVFNALQVGTDSEGGFLVPDEYERTLIEALQEENIFRKFAHVISTESGDRKIPVVASKGTASWIDEEAAYPESDDSFGQVSIGAHKLATMIKISEELLNDSVFDMPSYIAREFARRIGAAEEEAFFTGNGTGKPLGVLAATGGAGTGVTTASATAITASGPCSSSTIPRSRRSASSKMATATTCGRPASPPVRRTCCWAVPCTHPASCPLSPPVLRLSCSAIWVITGWLTARAVPSSVSTSFMPPPVRWASSRPSAWMAS